MSEDDFDGTDSLGRKKPAKRPAPRINVGDRKEGETIENWIKRESDRHVEKSYEMIVKRGEIKALAKEMREVGYAYLDAMNDNTALAAEVRRNIAAYTKKEKARIIEHRKKYVTPAKTKRGNVERRRKAQLAKYNTMYNRYFNAIKVIIFRNMKSLCNIKHTWADPCTKKSIQNTDLCENRTRNARKPIKEMEEKADAT